MLSTLMEPDRPSSPGKHDPDDYFFYVAEPEDEAHVMGMREREIENKEYEEYLKYRNEAMNLYSLAARQNHPFAFARLGRSYFKINQMFIRPLNYSRQRLRKEIKTPEIFIDVIIQDIMSGRLKKIIKLKRKKKART